MVFLEHHTYRSVKQTRKSEMTDNSSLGRTCDVVINTCVQVTSRLMSWRTLMAYVVLSHNVGIESSSRGGPRNVIQVNRLLSYASRQTSIQTAKHSQMHYPTLAFLSGYQCKNAMNSCATSKCGTRGAQREYYLT